jgi:hypothetical protein
VKGSTGEHTAAFRGARGSAWPMPAGAQTPPLAVPVDLELTLFRLWRMAPAGWVGAVSWTALCFWLVLSSQMEGFVLWAVIPPCAALLFGQVLLLVLKGIRRIR